MPLIVRHIVYLLEKEDISKGIATAKADHERERG